MRAVLIFVALAVSARSYASDIPPIEIRAINQSNVDVFETLQSLNAAKADYSEGKFAAAAQKFSQAYHYDAQLDGAAIGFADSLLAQGDLRRAHDIYKTLQSPRAQSGRLLISVLAGLNPSPEAALRDQLETQSGDPRLWNALGKVLDDQGNGNAARQAYAMAAMCGQAPGLEDNNIGQSFLQEGRYAAAAEKFSQAKRASPKAERFENNYRLALILHKDYRAALADLPEDRAANLLSDAGVIADGREEPELAKLLFTKALSLNSVFDARAARYLSTKPAP